MRRSYGSLKQKIIILESQDYTKIHNEHSNCQTVNFYLPQSQNQNETEF